MFRDGLPRPLVVSHGCFADPKTKLGEQHREPTPRSGVYGKLLGRLPGIRTEETTIIVDWGRRIAAYNPVDDHEHYLMVREQYRQVLAAMQTLEADERDILALTVSSQLSYREISSVTGISEANVKVKVHRARAKLRKIIQAGE